MDTPSASLRSFARRLLVVEGASTGGVNPQVHVAARVCEKLRISLTRFAGHEGFASLLRRALALARAEAPALQALALRPDGLVVGLEALAADEKNGGPEAVVTLVSHLLGLLVTFIGEPLTRRLVAEAWPHASLEKDPLEK